MSYVVPSRRAVTGLELLAILVLPVVASLVAILISTIAMMLMFDDLKTIEVLSLIHTDAADEGQAV